MIGRQPIANTSNITNNNTLSNDNNKLIKLVELLHASLGHAGKSTLINTLKKGILEGVNINSYCNLYTIYYLYIYINHYL